MQRHIIFWLLTSLNLAVFPTYANNWQALPETAPIPEDNPQTAANQ